jgi:NTE family protein
VSPEPVKRAVVLGGGGLAGIGWGCGYLAALEAAAVPLRDADLVVGTSAGSVVGAWLTGRRSLASRYRFVESSDHALRRAFGALFGAVAGEPDRTGEEALELLRASERPTPEALQRLGALAVASATMPEPVFVGFVSTLVGRRGWQTEALRVTVHDTATGERAVFGPHRSVGLGRACAASSAVPGFFPPVSVRGARFMDGGCRSATNADLAAGAERALVLALLPRPDATPAPAMLDEVEALERDGSRVYAAWPDAAAVDATDGRPLDPHVAPKVAQAGYEQGARDAATVAALWE